MTQDTATIIFNALQKNIHVDIEVPLFITANDLVGALNQGYNLGIDMSDIKNCFLQAEKPIALLRGNKMLRDFGVRDGTVVIYSR